MSERTERWLIVGACLLLYGVAMVAFSWGSAPVVKAAGSWLIASFGERVALAIVLLPPLAAGVWAIWPDPTYVQPPPPKLPRWVRLIGNAYLILLGLGLAAAFAAMIAVGMQ